MIKRYELDKCEIPTISVPHDCIIEKLFIDKQYLVFVFEDNLSYHDSIKAIQPNAKLLIIKYHLIDEDSFSLYVWKKKRLHKNGGYYENISLSDLSKIKGRQLEYLYHNVAYCSVITKLFKGNYVILDAKIDYMVYEWLIGS